MSKPEEKDITPESEATCGVEMREGNCCGRAIHPAPAHDAEPVCLMHSKDPFKSEEEFRLEFERILEDANQANTVADFERFVFLAVNYPERVFISPCNFSGATFTQDADFRGATFTQAANFSSATFTQAAEFYGARFTQNADFSFATFTQDANFSGARFTQAAKFDYATFTQDAYFRFATFTQDADFSYATFIRSANFRSAKILGAGIFREAEFRQDIEAKAGLVFSRVRIENPERVEFYHTDLGQALFVNTDVSKFDFTLVKWRERGQQRGIRRGALLRWISRQHSSRLCLFEEDVALEEAPPLRPLEGSPDERNYQLIAETYQQLKRNFDAKGDYWTAGHWHYGEMEMQRLHCDWTPRWARWLKQNLSLVALYKYTSAYGESYTLPLMWLAGVLAFFAMVYPAVGLEIHMHDVDKVLRYSNYAEFFRVNPGEHPGGFWGVLLHGAMASLSVAGFQRELRYAPSYPWGRLLALLELLLTTTMGALFALAIRRQFKRS